MLRLSTVTAKIVSGWLILVMAAGLSPPAHAAAAAATTRIQVQVCPQANLTLNLTVPEGLRTSLSQLPLSGGTKAGLTIAVNDNNHPNKVTLLKPLQQFVVNLPLQEGWNHIIVTARNACGQSSSAHLNVYRTHSFASPFRAWLWLLFGLLLILLLLWLLLYKRRHKHEDSP